MSSSQPNSRIPLATRQRSILLDFYNRNPYPSARVTTPKSTTHSASPKSPTRSPSRQPST
ncbi:unnamed protein product, partial [Rotaria sp. Silwood1]